MSQQSRTGRGAVKEREEPRGYEREEPRGYEREKPTAYETEEVPLSSKGYTSGIDSSKAAPAGQPQGLMTEEVSGSMAKCSKCQRSFFVEKLAKHEAVCPGIVVKKYVKSKVGACAATTAAATAVPKPGKSAAQKREDQAICKAMPKWKQQSEELKNAMRAARAYSKGGDAAVAALGPSVPLAPDPSLKQCPHCERRFNPSAFERHVQHCQHSKNKPKRLLRGTGGAGGVTKVLHESLLVVLGGHGIVANDRHGCR